MKLGEILLRVPVDPDVGRDVQVEDEHQVDPPPDLEHFVHSQLLIEYLEEQVQSLVTRGLGESFDNKIFTIRYEKYLNVVMVTMLQSVIWIS